MLTTPMHLCMGFLGLSQETQSDLEAQLESNRYFKGIFENSEKSLDRLRKFKYWTKMSKKDICSKLYEWMKKQGLVLYKK